MKQKKANINDPFIYDKYIVAFSGGKDSVASFLHLLDLGIPKSRIELWHSDIDGREKVFMDWEVTHDYCKKFAEAFGVEIYFNWKEGGFKREMNRENQRTAPTHFECPDGTIKTIGGTRGKESTRKKFPQISPDLSVRWCSAYLKIDVASAAIRNQDRFNNIKTVVISGERAEEALKPKKFVEYLESVENNRPLKSKGRAGYMYLEIDRADRWEGKKRRYVDRWRPVKDWTEAEVWGIIKRYKVNPHPCYKLGWSRCSCKYCIFGNADQFASAYFISPEQGNVLIGQEASFGVTMKRDMNLVSLIEGGNIYSTISDELTSQAISYEFTESIFTKNWVLPAGAFGESCGPT